MAVPGNRIAVNDMHHLGTIRISLPLLQQELTVAT
jgi:hypothetical protein